MAEVGLRGAVAFESIDGGKGGHGRLFDLSSPAGWTMLFWWASVLLIVLTLVLL